MNTKRARSSMHAVGALLPLVGAALVPKCPLCVAAMLASLGVGLGAAQTLAPWLRASLVGLALAAGALAMWKWWRKRALRRSPCC